MENPNTKTESGAAKSDSLPLLVRNLREHANRIAGDGPNGSNYDPETLDLEHRAADAIEMLLAQRKEWKCSVGGKTFRTDDPSVAEEWRTDGLDVESCFVPNSILMGNACVTDDTRVHG